MEDSIFTKIIKGEIPSHKIYEDDRVLAFLDIHPISRGHTLVIPKKQVEFVWDLESEDYQALMSAVQKLGGHLRDVLGVPFVGVKIIGTDVPHAHVHLVPFTDDEIHHQPDMSAEPDHEALDKLASELSLSV
jgi:histidine triad (HIT) family protein